MSQLNRRVGALERMAGGSGLRVVVCKVGETAEEGKARSEVEEGPLGSEDLLVVVFKGCDQMKSGNTPTGGANSPIR